MDDDQDVVLPYVEDPDTKARSPLPGVVVILCTPTGFERIEAVDIDRRVRAFQEDDPNYKRYPKMVWVPREMILQDIKFRGATGDFAGIRAEIEACPMEMVLARANEEDIYDDATNLMFALADGVAEIWEAYDTEMARRQKRDAILAAQEAAAEAAGPKVERKKKKKKKKRKTKRDWLKQREGPYVAQPWISSGSEEAIRRSQVVPTRERLLMQAFRPRGQFGRSYAFGSKDAQELWNSSHMAVNHYRDDNFSIHRLEVDHAVQAVPQVRESSVQASALRRRPQAVATQPRSLGEDECRAQLSSEGLAQFLTSAMARVEEALQMNEVLDVFEDQLGGLGADAVGVDGATQGKMADTPRTSFSTTLFSSGKSVSALQWMPGRKGSVLVAMARADSFDGRVKTSGTPDSHYVLLWNFKDAIEPELVLEAPSEVFAFAINPNDPNLVAGGCYNGQVVLWDLAGVATGGSTTKKDPSEGADTEATATGTTTTTSTSTSSNKQHNEGGSPRVPFTLISQLEEGHSKCVMDVKWLPGVEISRRGDVIGLAGDGLEVGSQCFALVTTGTDGNLTFWDTRPEKYAARQRPGRDKEVIDARMSWIPVHSIKLVAEGGDILCRRLCVQENSLSSELSVGSAHGQYLRCTYTVPADAGVNPDLVKQLHEAHDAPVSVVMRSPFFPELTLTVGGWSFAVWHDDLAQPIFQSPLKGARQMSGKQEDLVQLTCGTWSLTRPGLIFVGREDGHLESWDLLDRSHEPSEIAEVIVPRALTTMSFHPSLATMTPAQRATSSLAGLLAMGDSEGTLHVMNLPGNLVRWSNQREAKEVETMEAFWRRQAARVQGVKALLDSPEMGGGGDKNKRAGGGGGGGGDDEEDRETVSASPAMEEVVITYDAAAAARYAELEAEYKAKCGLNPPETFD